MERPLTQDDKGNWIKYAYHLEDKLDELTYQDKPTSEKFEWERIDDYHQRCPVHGGWLVKAYEDVYHNLYELGKGMVPGYDMRISMCFVPDVNHEWKIQK